ncbi:MAG: PIN domain-containing protein [Planctomycetota bacterium]
MRIFLDTNVLVSAFATRGLCADVLRVVLAEHEFLTGEIVLSELEDVLTSRIGLPPKTVGGILALLRRYHVEPRPAYRPDLPISDADDLLVLGSALACGADVFVTGDEEILAVEKPGDILILNPRGLWDILKGGS